MDGMQRETKPTREVKRSFEGSRSAIQIITAAYEWVAPGTRCRIGAESAHRTGGEADARSDVGGSTARRQATGA